MVKMTNNHAKVTKKGASKGMSEADMHRKLKEILTPDTDAEVRMKSDGSYTVYAVTKKIV